MGAGHLHAASTRRLHHHAPLGPAVQTALIGFFSQLVGIFGTLVFLDERENTFSVPVNRSSSILAEVVASYVLAIWLDMQPASWHQLAGAGRVIAAVLALSLAPTIEKRRAAQAEGW